MKLINIPVELRNGVKKQGQNGEPNESFIMLGLTTVRLAFNEDLEILSISVNNGEKIYNPTSIKIEDGKLKVEIEKKDDLVTDKEPPVTEKEPPVTFKKPPVTYNPPVALEPPVQPSIPTIIDGADGRPFASPTPVSETPKNGLLKLGDIADELKQGMKKIGTDGAPNEIFSIIRTNLLRICYNPFTEEVTSAEVNGEIFDNPTSITLVDGELNVTVKAADNELNNQPSL